ncbi:MAG: hypothetical protein JOS17DRAFT_731702 [Linnemannia elongata]|nr:MAG: hypothetical protein JOS17DRAFT_731702 [Linnemannia elongata]
MESAYIRFFDSPELVRIVASFLPRKAVTELMRVNKALHEAGVSVVYRTLTEADTHRIGNSIDALVGLSRNADHVREITMRHFFCDTYLDGASAFVMSTVSSSQIPDFDPQSSMFQPFTRLASFRCKVRAGNPPCIAKRDTPVSYDSGVYLVQIGLLMGLNRGLVHLVLDDLPINGNTSLSVFCNSLLELDQLESLELGLMIPADAWDDHVIWEIFSSCSGTIREFKFHPIRRRRNRPDDITGDSPIKAADRPAMRRRRREPFKHLQDWDFSTERGFSKEIICAMVSRCPALVRMEMPTLDNKRQDSESVGWYIGEHCPKLEHLTRKILANSDCNGSLMGAILESLPKDTVKSIVFEGFQFNDYSFVDSMHRHFGSLTKLEFEFCRRFASDDVRTILEGCRVLEEFMIQAKPVEMTMIPLKELVSFEWASQALRELTLSILVQSMREFSKMTPGESKGESVISEAQKTGPSLTGKLYRRLQSMTNLEHFQGNLWLGNRKEELKYTSMGPGRLTGGESKSRDSQTLTLYRHETMEELEAFERDY